MTLQFNCPSCSHQLKVKGSQQAGACPHCAQPLNVKIVVSTAMEQTADDSGFRKTEAPKPNYRRPWKCSGVPHGAEQLANSVVG